MAIKAVDARCIGCGAEVKTGQTRCKCGDPVAIRPPNPRPRRELVAAEEETTPAKIPAWAQAGNPMELDIGHVNRGVHLSGEQEAALTRIGDWWAQHHYHGGPAPLLRLFGPAGVGKTTLIRELHRELANPNVVYGAYTGKAAHVMRQKGIPATTIHGAIYKPVDNREARVAWEAATRQLSMVDPDEPLERENLLAEIEKLEEAIRHGVAFELNPMSAWADADLIVLDEVSMVNESVALDIESFGVPILVLGDPFQLPPVDGGGYYTNRPADITLKEPHRFFLESQVGNLANRIRTGGSWAADLVRVDLAAAMQADQILCWKNSTRHALTEKIRAKKARPAGVPVPGDRVMCLVNNKDLGVFNGQQFEVLEKRDDGDIEFLLRDDEGVEVWHNYDPDGFRGAAGEKEAKARRRHTGKVGLFTFAEVITTHKAQGSGWPHVYVVDQTHLMWRATELEKRRWLYTAVTRASERVTIASTEVR